MSKYRQFYDEDEDENVDFTVFIIHGRSTEVSKVERFIRDDLQFNAIVLQNSYSGTNIPDKFKNEVWEKALCAVAIMSPDDKLDNGNYRARQNVFYELGYCSGIFDSYYEEDLESQPIIILKEKSIYFQDVSDLLGIDYMGYQNGAIEATFFSLAKALHELYEELGGSLFDLSQAATILLQQSDYFFSIQFMRFITHIQTVDIQPKLRILQNVYLNFSGFA
jgi:predicted nucleotide-binding protein